MKTLLHGGRKPGCAVLVCLAIGTHAPASAQIIITAADLSAQLAPGNIITSRTDTSTKSINIGTPGATSWDYSALVTNITAQSMCVRPDTTPFYSFFPGSTNAQRVPVAGLGTLYSYIQLGTDLLVRGSAVTGIFQERISDAPSEVLYKLPLTMGTTWTASYVESTIVALPPAPPSVTLATHTMINSVDAYGNLTLPGGGVYAALRVKTDSRIIAPTHTSRSIYYTILASNGASALVVAADTLQPDNGVIKAASIARVNPLVTDVASAETVPATFALDQNYPNPFNPSTMIRYRLAAAGYVRLAVYDLLGRELRTLVNERVPAGSHEARFDATGLSTGVYVYRLTSDQHSESRTMIVLR